MSNPDVSVVMAVYNGGAALAPTLASVLGQEGCDFEVIAIDDGSTDGSGAVLDDWAARDPRLRVIHQENTGLTRALVRGCALARGEFIARQDCGDISLPGRLASQAAFLRQHPQAVMAGSGVRFIGPRGEPLVSVVRHGLELHEGLARLDVAAVQGPPHHGATIFRRAAYERAGGYREFFTVAQDLDLWLRLRELGQCLGDAAVRYEARVEEGSISARRRNLQFAMARIAVECARTRAAGADDAACFPSERPAARDDAAPARLVRARFLYFVGSCLRQSDPRAARAYYWAAWRSWPLMLKSLWRYTVR